MERGTTPVVVGGLKLFRSILKPIGQMIQYHISAKIEPRHQRHIEGTSGSLATTPTWFFMARSSMRPLDQGVEMILE